MTTGLSNPPFFIHRFCRCKRLPMATVIRERRENGRTKFPHVLHNGDTRWEPVLFRGVWRLQGSLQRPALFQHRHIFLGNHSKPRSISQTHLPAQCCCGKRAHVCVWRKFGSVLTVLIACYGLLLLLWLFIFYCWHLDPIHILERLRELEWYLRLHQLDPSKCTRARKPCALSPLSFFS